MARVTAPLFGFDASGQIGKTLVNGKWKGRPYARRYVVPANPDSDAQKLTRGIFAYLFGLYRYGASAALSALEAAANAAQITTANMICKANLSTMRSNINNDNLVLSPGSGGAPATPTFVVTPGSNDLSCAIPAPVLPNGWSATPTMYAAAVKEWSGAGYADIGADYTMVEDQAGAPVAGSYTVDLTGLDASTEYTVVAFYSVVRPDGTTAWGVSSVQTASTTA